jgi:hypothetical protein
MPSLSVSLGDTVRALLRFDVPARTRVRRAELVLKAAPSQQPPPAAFELGIHEVESAWDELKVTWKTQPTFAARPALTVRVDPRTKELRIDLTALVQKTAGAHGWLLEVPHLLPLARRSPDANLESALLGLLPCEKTAAEARTRAAGEGKLVLAVVRATFSPDQPNLPESLLLATALSDPDVLALVRSRFVAVRVSYPPTAHLLGKPAAGTDPLAPLGTSARQTKAPALVVADPRGKAVARLVSIGTFDRDLVLRFLLDALAGQKGGLAEKDAWKLLRAGQLAHAREAFARMKSRAGSSGLGRVASLRGQHPVCEHALRTCAAR